MSRFDQQASCLNTMTRLRLAPLTVMPEGAVQASHQVLQEVLPVVSQGVSRVRVFQRVFAGFVPLEDAHSRRINRLQ